MVAAACMLLPSSLGRKVILAINLLHTRLTESLCLHCRRQLGGKLGSSLEQQLGLQTAGDLMRVPLEKLQDLHGKNVG